MTPAQGSGTVKGLSVLGTAIYPDHNTQEIVLFRE